MRSSTVLALALSLTLVACGGSGDPKEDGYTALNSGDHAAALASFDKALAAIDSSAEDYVEVAVARCRALAHVEPERSLSEFTTLSEKNETLEASDFREVVTELLSAEGGAESAVWLMDVGCKRFPDSEKMKATRDKVIAAVKKRGDKGATDALDGLGYLGGD
ncbi:MAG: hypothetical protein GY711_19850 [bacterium]|nr:hypothetical protein [bacterium]